MIKINIDQCTEEELVDLNHRIVERLRFLNQMRAHAQMLEFKVGERVTFTDDRRAPVIGMLTRYNKKTVTIITDDGQRWNVSPGVLSKVDSFEETDSTDPKVIPLKRDHAEG